MGINGAQVNEVRNGITPAGGPRDRGGDANQSQTHVHMGQLIKPKTFNPDHLMNQGGRNYVAKAGPRQQRGART